MEVLTLLIAVAALVIAVLAFQRTGGIEDLRRQMEDISSKSARETVADALDRLENLIRGQQKSQAEARQGNASSTFASGEAPPPAYSEPSAKPEGER
ncbi:MAG: hypothetical protein D6690_04700 [Nitrospirae bacterium]|nr:MAG: hypothetical protein D6690_04700 [Nitrospirota bacterium]